MPTSRTVLAEVRYRDKTLYSREVILTGLEDLRARRPDIYIEQIRKLRGSDSSDVEPSKLSLPDQAIIMGYAIEFLLGGYAPLTVPETPNDETEQPQTAHKGHSAQPPNLNGMPFAQSPLFNPQRSQRSPVAHSSQPSILNGMTFQPQFNTQGSSSQSPNLNNMLSAQSSPFNPQGSQPFLDSQSPHTPIQNGTFFMQSPNSQALKEPSYPTSHMSYPAVSPPVVPATNGPERLPMSPFANVFQTANPHANGQSLTRPDNDEDWFNFQKGGMGDGGNRSI